jgi:glycerophosphoryl diester phosphodiesterase
VQSANGSSRLANDGRLFRLRGSIRYVSFAVLVAVLAAAASPELAPVLAAKPIIIGHRGASGYRPEHTLAAYALAIDMSADFIEPDLVSTKDGVLVARHENYIGGDSDALVGEDSTDVASRPEFADRKTTKLIDGVSLTGWFTEDFTLAELKTLRARERLPGLRAKSASFNGAFDVPTLQEIIDLVRAREAATGRTIGIYPETKHPSYFDAIGLSLEEPLVAVLAANGYDSADDAIFIQSFEVANLKQLNALTGVRLVQLLGDAGRPFDFEAAGDPRSYDDMTTPAGLAEIAGYADGIGPNKGRVIPVVAGMLSAATDLVMNAHAAGLVVHPYTFRSENAFLPDSLRAAGGAMMHGDHAAEYRQFLKAGVDGMFSDYPDHAVRARDALSGGWSARR